MHRESLRPYVWMMTACVAFAFMGALAHAAGGHCDWQIVAVARSSLALFFGFLYARMMGVRLVLRGPRVLWIRSISGSISMVCTFYALTRLPVSDVLAVTNMFPIWVAVLSWPLLGEPPAGQVWLSALSGIAGVWLIQQPHFHEADVAVAAAAVASFFTAVAMLGLNRVQGIDPRAIVVHFSAVALVFCFTAYLVFERKTAPVELCDPVLLLMLLGMGLMATVGQVFLTLAFTLGNPSRVAVVGLTQIVFALVLDVLFLGYRIQWLSLAGIALVVAPSAWLMARRRKRAPPEEAPPV